MQCKVLKSFKGSPDGRYAVDYTAGDVVELTDSLAEVALKEKWAERIGGEAAGDAKPAKGRKAATAPATPIGDAEDLTARN